MALKEYNIDGRTYLFDEDSAPKHAELVGDVVESVSPGSFDDLVMAAHDKRGKRGRQAANKAAPAPANKDEADQPADVPADQPADAPADAPADGTDAPADQTATDAD